MRWEGGNEPTDRVGCFVVARPRRNYRLCRELDGRAQRRGDDVRRLTHSGQEGPGRAEGREPGGGELPRQGSACHLRSGPGDGGAVNLAVLKKDEWNVLVDLIQSGQLTKV